MGALAVGLVGLLGIVLVVVSMCSVFVVVGCIVVVGCVVGIGIGVVIGIDVRRVVSCSKPARMLAFSTAKLMHCGGGVMDRGGRGIGVVLVGSGGGVLVDVGSQLMGF